MSRLHASLRLLALVSLLLLAGGCGQKGPLYLPDEPPSEQTDDDSNSS